MSIAKSLNSMGIKTHRGNQIENRTIEYWLNNPVYIGKTRWNPDGKLSRNYTADTAIISDSTHTPIIDTETWDKVRERMKEQKAKFGKYYNPDRKDLSHWLTGIVRCEKMRSCTVKSRRIFRMFKQKQRYLQGRRIY